MLNGEFVLDIDYERYVLSIARVLQHFYRYPQGKRFIRSRRNKQGEIIGWEIDDEECRFIGSDSYLVADEAVKKDRNGWCFSYFKYHFQPEDVLQAEEYYAYRIDLDKNSLHANPDDSLRLPEHMEYPEHLKLNIERFNLVAALYCANHYLKSQKYPLHQENEKEYNDLIGKIYEGVKR